MVCVSNSSLNNFKFIQLLSQKIYQSLQLGNVIPQDIYSIYSYFHLLVYGKPIGQWSMEHTWRLHGMESLKKMNFNPGSIYDSLCDLE